jgi:hypothetical protein
VSHSYDEIPNDLHDVDARMRDSREEWTAVELDRIKLRAMQSGRKESTVTMVNRVTRKLVALTLAATVGIGGVAVAAGNHGGGTKPGHGCGDKNHYHEQRAGCK